MPRTEQENAKIRAKRRNEILDAAIEIFAKKGYEKTSCDDINKKVGCSHGLFYRHFKSKDDVYNALIEKYKDLYLNKATKIMESDEDPKIIIKKLIAFFISTINESKKEAYKMFIVLTSSIVKSNHKKDVDKNILQFLIELIMKTRLQSGVIDENHATSIAMSVYYMLIGMCYTKINFSKSRDDSYQEMENVFMNIILQG